ncbi:predicted protein [Nematostella vectensis]|uniref:LanC-like protein 2 n=1 Tax=Nematostella vectensis TaxID=45351 RepID=A7S296_NEMVE|nr:predicted protein [Nematostella vectensis]|eukprot:XP_001634261.1 predicted protein [Nematostella vectensis]
MASERREFENKFSDYDGRTRLLSEKGKIEEPFLSNLTEQALKMLRRYEEGLKSERDESNHSVYTGSGGAALLYLHLASTLFRDDKEKRECYLSSALQILEQAAKNLTGRRVTFLCGDAGIHAMLAVLYEKLGRHSESTRCIQELYKMTDRVLHDQSLPDEVLYGRAGYLYSLLHVQQEIGINKIDRALIDQICSAVVSSGLNLAKHLRHQSPLMYAWHGKHYLGAAHGIVGILYMLLQAVSCPSVQSNLSTIEECIDFFLSLQFPSGNFPSSLGNSSDKLVHWCHGAPGAIHLLLKAHKVFGKEKYLNAAQRCGEVIWRRGLLKKGYGICHGVAGNGYALLALYKATNESKYLYRAIKFADWCKDYGKHGCRTPDTPFSLFEGMAGTVHFLADLIEPRSSLLPGFELIL